MLTDGSAGENRAAPEMTSPNGATWISLSDNMVWTSAVRSPDDGRQLANDKKIRIVMMAKRTYALSLFQKALVWPRSRRRKILTTGIR